MILYDDDGKLVTNRETLEALEESERIIAAWRKLHKINSGEDNNKNAENF